MEINRTGRMMSVHQSPYSGSWYPGDRTTLRRLLDELFERSARRTGPYTLPDPKAFVVPHAGLMYSGTVAAAAYRCLEAYNPERVILLGFSHRGGPQGIAIPDIECVATPLGDALLDRETMENLSRKPGFHLVPEKRLCDHSVEMQFPPLQRVVPKIPLTPLYVGHMSASERRSAAEVLARLASSRTVFLASSDLSHYGKAFRYEPFPADDCIAERLRAVDQRVIASAASLDPEFFLDTLSQTGSTVCGVEPIALLLTILGFLEGDEVFQQELDYQTSGEMTNDFRHSVSYGALGYFPARSFGLSRTDQLLLLDSACATLHQLMEAGGRETMPPREITPSLTRKAGVFVTLRKDGALRGCVGNAVPRQSLGSVVPQLALAAALDDPRFPPLVGPEPGLEVEISILSPVKRIRDASLFRLGEHGACLELRAHHSLLLPQAACGRGWDAAKFFEALAGKAGLGPHACNEPGAELYVFRAEVFRGSDMLC